jgi:hypothetical protein
MMDNRANGNCNKQPPFHNKNMLEPTPAPATQEGRGQNKEKTVPKVDNQVSGLQKNNPSLPSTAMQQRAIEHEHEHEQKMNECIDPLFDELCPLQHFFG